jgi:hypothetical protein
MMKKEGRFYPLRYVSRILTKLERAYENQEREVRAGVYAMQSPPPPPSLSLTLRGAGGVPAYRPVGCWARKS